MRALTTLLFILLCHPAMAVICKTVDADGNVTYSDVPAAECRQRVRLPESSTYAPRQLPATILPNSAGVSTERFTGYRRIRIDQPASNGTVRSNQGELAVSVMLEPSLQEGHRLQVMLDGIAIQPPFTTQAAILSGVHRGTHSLNVHVQDASGRTLISAVPVSFTLRKAAIGGEQAEVPDNSDGDSGGGDPGDNTGDSDGLYQPPDNSKSFNPAEKGPDYSSPDADYQSKPLGNTYAPPAAPTPATPRGTNPAFAPKFNP